MTEPTMKIGNWKLFESSVTAENERTDVWIDAEGDLGIEGSPWVPVTVVAQLIEWWRAKMAPRGSASMPVPVDMVFSPLPEAGERVFEVIKPRDGALGLRAGELVLPVTRAPGVAFDQGESVPKPLTEEHHASEEYVRSQVTAGLEPGDKVLLSNQSDPARNGLHVFGEPLTEAAREVAAEIRRELPLCAICGHLFTSCTCEKDSP